MEVLSSRKDRSTCDVQPAQPRSCRLARDLRLAESNGSGNDRGVKSRLMNSFEISKASTMTIPTPCALLPSHLSVSNSSVKRPDTPRPVLIYSRQSAEQQIKSSPQSHGTSFPTNLDVLHVDNFLYRSNFRVWHTSLPLDYSNRISKPSLMLPPPSPSKSHLQDITLRSHKCYCPEIYTGISSHEEAGESKLQAQTNSPYRQSQDSPVCDSSPKPPSIRSNTEQLAHMLVKRAVRSRRESTPIEPASKINTIKSRTITYGAVNGTQGHTHRRAMSIATNHKSRQKKKRQQRAITKAAVVDEVIGLWKEGGDWLSECKCGSGDGVVNDDANDKDGRRSVDKRHGMETDIEISKLEITSSSSKAKL